jgi:hypothetical protein
MNPQYIDATNVDNNSDNTTETESQQCMSDSVTKSYNSFFGDEHLPEGHITAHPFSLTLEELSDLLKNGHKSCESVTTKTEAISQNLQVTHHQDCSGSTEDSRELSQSKPAENSGCLNQSTFSGFIQDGQPNQTKSEAPQTKLHQESRVSTDYSVEKFSNKPVGKSGENKKSTSVGQSSDSPINCEKAPPLETLPNKDSRVSTDYSVEKFPNKPVGGSGWLHKYTKLTETKTGLVEYPRVKEGQRSTNNPKHWYWNYCWHKKGKNGKPLYKKGKAVVSSVGCPQKKVRVVEGAILLTQRSANAAKLPHRQILEIIKGDNSPPPPT